MVLYFSGTGNSKLVAKIIAKKTGDECVDLFNRLKNQDYSMMHSDKPWVIVVPTYAYQIPYIVEHWLKKTILEGNNKIYFVMTFGSSSAGAFVMNEQIAKDINKEYMGTAKIKMPENYIAMFPVPNKEESIKIIEAALPSIKRAIFCIKRDLKIDEVKLGAAKKVLRGWSVVVNKVFFSKFVSDKQFKVDMDKCISCGKCERVCVNENVGLFGGEPFWLGNCTHCMACICKCPTQAIEYGRKTKNKYRYNCPV